MKKHLRMSSDSVVIGAIFAKIQKCTNTIIKNNKSANYFEVRANAYIS